MIEAGMIFGMLTAISPIGSGKFWLCRCECGEETKASRWHLERNRRKSCGCRLKSKENFIQCLECVQIKPRADFYVRPNGVLFSATCKECTKERVSKIGRARHHLDKCLAIEHYGGKCECCGETHFEFLQIDHTGGGGAEHRKQIGTKSIYRVLRQVNYPEDFVLENGQIIRFRVLCANCNTAHGHYGFCPHTSPQKAAAISDNGKRPSSQAAIDYLLRLELRSQAYG